MDPQVLIAIGLILVAVLSLRSGVSTTTLVVFAMVVPSIILHEVSHGLAALALGDDTARAAGRLSLNPFRHIDPFGTVVLPALLALSGLGAFGYAKPVPVNTARLRSPRNSAVLVALAGPACNLLLAAASVVALRWFRPAGTAAAVHAAVSYFGLGALDFTDRAIYLFGFVNVLLAVFNALPVPPLDGSSVITRLVPSSALPAWYRAQRYAMPVVLMLVLLNPGNFLGHLIGSAERFWAGLLTA